MANHRFSITVDEETYKKLTERSKSTGESIAESARYFMKRGIGLSFAEDSLDIIASVVRQQMEVTIKPHVERLAALSSKTGHMASRSTFLNVQALQDLVPAEKKKDVVAMYDKASKKAAEYMRSRLDDEGVDPVE